jgi:hypothetical protein
MTGPLGAAFVTGLGDDQLLALEELAEEYMIEILTQVVDKYADRMLEQEAARAPIVAAAVSPDEASPASR